MSGAPFELQLRMLDLMEEQIDRWNERIDREQEIQDSGGEPRPLPRRARLARSGAEVRAIAAAGEIAIVHTLEGAHALECKVERLDQLHERGVAMITLSHFFANGLGRTTGGIPKTSSGVLRRLCPGLDPYAFSGGPARGGLTAAGRRFVSRMRELGMLIDVTHSAEEMRRDIYDLLGTDVPVVATHVGAHALHEDPYNLKDDEIGHIAASGGAVGVIFMNYWLDPHPPELLQADAGLENIWRTARQIQEASGGSWDHVMIGTDFDGFSDPPDDVVNASQLGKVTAKFLERGLSRDDAKKVLGGNALRVLESVWR